MTYDLIIVSQSSGKLIQMTENCIASARKDEADLNIILVETGQPYKYDVDRIITYNGEFNYNRALNIGLKYVKGDIYILANNDLIFHNGWSQIGELMRANDYHSASCRCGRQTEYKEGYLYEGYGVGGPLNGWCIFLDKYCLDKISPLDETMPFWYSDNLYSHQIEAAGIKHGLFGNCRVDHLTSQTLRKQPPRVMKKYQLGEFNKYILRSKHYAQRERID